ncbi:MAG: hypothetical protein J0M12_11370 [Deltaproteobacteria bacterium]|nr:hypothetical protein [Deltaproteobacteria bacterium]
MSNSPIKPLTARDSQPVKAIESAPLASEPAQSGSAPANSEAISVSVPRTQAKNSIASDPSGPLGSLLRGLRESGDISSAHGGLDASRVFGLLDDEDEGGK